MKARIAKALGWTEKDVDGFSLASLRELIRVSHPKLAAEITQAIKTGSHIRQ